MPNVTPLSPHPSMSRRERRLESAIERVRAVIDQTGVAGVVLTRPGTVAWASGGINPPIDRGAPIDTVWLAISDTRCTVITTEVEAPRITAELLPAGMELVAVPWWDAEAFAVAAGDVLESDLGNLGSDGHPAFGRDLDHELQRVRLPLSEPERDDLRELGRDAAEAVETALRNWQPGETDRDIAARVVAHTEHTGADAPCLLVGGDERLQSFRHPVANGSRPERVVMAVLVARRDGLHVALTRHAATRADPVLERGLTACRAIHRGVLDQCRPGARFGDALTALDAGYRNAGAEGEWRSHYQGGPIGYGQREFEIAPCQTTSAWWDESIDAGVAMAWNPSLPGGAKDEDTYLVGADACELVTTTGGWPMVADEGGLPRPAVLGVA